jgi:N-acetylglutamate synthase-like GNAT family acetyltransferase
MFIASWFPGSADLEKIQAVRAEVLGRDKLLPRYIAGDAREAAAYLLVTLEDGTPVAAAKLALRGDSLEISDIAVRDLFKDQGYEEFALRMLLYKARQMPYDRITAWAFREDIPMYLKFGFIRTGEPVLKDGKTISELAVNCGGIIWESACKQ